MSNALLPPWQRRDNFGLLAHQRVVDRINETTNLTHGGKTEVMSSPSGRGLIDQTGPTPPRKVGLYRLSATSPPSGGGKYWLNEVLPATGDVVPTVDVSSATFGTTDTTNVLGCNAAEEGGTGHDLDASHFPQVFLAYTIQVNSDGTKVVGFDSEQWESCPASGAPSPSDGGAGASYALIGI